MLRITNIILLVIGFCLQSFLWFQVIKKESHPAIIYLGFWALAVLSLVLLFFANQYTKKSLPSQITLFVATTIIAVIGPLWMYSAYFVVSDAQSGIAVVLEPFLALIICGISIAIAISLKGQTSD